MTTKKQFENCRTHHKACDCREFNFDRMESALKVIRTWASLPLSTTYQDIINKCDEALKFNE